MVLIPFAGARAEDCGREAFASVVEHASAELSAMNEANKKRFHEKLQTLKSRAGWSDADFVTQATPFIRDERISAFDTQNKLLLAKVPELGNAERTVASLANTSPAIGTSADGRCGMMNELRGLMAAVVENSRAKWTYMFGKVDAALEKSGEAKAGQ
jgi:hypothetical protein